MRRHLLAAAALAQALAWTPATQSVRRTPLHAAEETDALAQIQSRAPEVHDASSSAAVVATPRPPHTLHGTPPLDKHRSGAPASGSVHGSTGSRGFGRKLGRARFVLSDVRRSRSALAADLGGRPRRGACAVAEHAHQILGVARALVGSGVAEFRVRTPRHRRGGHRVRHRARCGELRARRAAVPQRGRGWRRAIRCWPATWAGGQAATGRRCTAGRSVA